MRLRAAQLPLIPGAFLFGGMAALRAALYRRGWLPRERLAGPVISVGNLSVGGSGKTPLVWRLAELLRDQGRRVAILSRGYRGSFGEPALVVGDGQRVLATAEQAGDEPVMLAQGLPGVIVVVARRRALAGRLVERNFGPVVHLLDDGFQHLGLARDVDILCLRPADLRDRPLPAGRLREFSSAAARADLFLAEADGAAPSAELQALEERWGAARFFRFRRAPQGFFDPAGRAQPAPRRAWLAAAVARPERFVADVRGQGTKVVGQRFFRDHHRFSAAEIEQLAAQARAQGADSLVVTAKDAVRLGPAELGLPVLVLRISLAIDGEARLMAALIERLGAAAERAGVES